MSERIREAPPRKADESLTEYIARLESFGATAGDQRIRIHPDYIDERGNLLVRPVVAYAVADDATVHPFLDTEGFPFADLLGSWKYRDLTGTYTKTGGGGAGLVNVSPASGDEVIILGCHVQIGGAAAVPGELILQLTDSGGTSVSRQFGYIVAVGISANYYFPPLPGAVADLNAPDLSPMLSRLLSNDTDSGTGANLNCRIVNMAITETYNLSIAYLTKTNTAMTVLPTGGTFA